MNNNLNENGKIIGYDAQTGQPIYQTQITIVDEKEIKRLKKENIKSKRDCRY